MFEKIWERVGGEDVRERIEQLREEYEKSRKEREEECEKSRKLLERKRRKLLKRKRRRKKKRRPSGARWMKRWSVSPVCLGKLEEISSSFCLCSFLCLVMCQK